MTQQITHSNGIADDAIEMRHLRDITESTAANDFLVGEQVAGVWSWVKKTQAETRTIIVPGLATSITAGKTLTLAATDDYTLTIPATGTVALLAIANIFTTAQKINVNSTTAFVVEQDGVKDDVLTVDTTNGRVGLGDTYLSADNRKIYLGGGNDLSAYYDGTSGYIKADEIAASDLHISCGIDKTLVLDESVWDDIQFPIASGRMPASSAPTWETFTTNTAAFAFSVDDYIDLQADEPPHGWSEGTNGSVHLHFVLKTAQNTGADRFAKFTVWMAVADVGGLWSEIGPFTAEQTIATGSGALKHFLLTLGTATLTGYHLGVQIKTRVKRIAATGGTEYADDVYITQVGMHVEKVRIGSRSVSAA